MADKRELESKVEGNFVDYVVRDGNLSLKYELRAGDPDQLVLLQKGNHFFIEFKREGEEPRKLQWYRIKELRRMGHAVYWTDDYEEALAIYKYEKMYKTISTIKRSEVNKKLQQEVRAILERRG